MSRVHRIAAALAMLLVLGGCLSLIKEPDAITTYSLRHLPSETAPGPSVNWSLTIIRPNSGTLLDSNRIAVRPKPNILQVYQGANWSDTLPDLVQSHLVETFENSKRIQTVSRQNSGVPAELALLIDIRNFEADYGNGNKIPSAVIRIHAKLLEYPSNRVLAVMDFDTETPASDKSIPAVVQAFEQSLNRSSGEIVEWALANGRSKAKAK
jgi:cholesterol transport system auxiliary component